VTKAESAQAVFHASVKPEAELKQMKTFNADELNALGESIKMEAGIIANGAEVSLGELCRYLAPFQDTIDVSEFVYSPLVPLPTGASTCRLPGYTLFSLPKVFSREELEASKLGDLLPRLELARYYVDEIEPQFLDTTKSLRGIEKSRIHRFTRLTSVEKYCFYREKEWSEVVERLKAAFVARTLDELQDLLNRCHVIFLSGPDATETDVFTELAVEVVPGAQLAQYPMVLDDDGMIAFTEEGQISRDTTKPKVMQPVYKVISKTRRIPKLANYDRPLDISAVTLLTVRHVRLLSARCREFYEQLEKTLETKFNSLSKAHMKSLLKDFKDGVRKGLKLTIPSGKEGPGYSYAMFPKPELCEEKLKLLKEKMRSLGQDKLTCIKNFSISNRPTISAELALYLTFLRDSSLKDEHKFSRFCQAALCVMVLKDDVNYHVLLDEAQANSIRYISQVLVKLGERLFEYEERNKAGLGASTIMLLFPAHLQKVGIMFVTSHYNEENGRWDRYLHYNPNACAAEEFNRLMGFSPPKEVEHGVKMECIFNAGTEHTILLTFQKHVIETTKREVDEKAREAIKKHDYHDESGLGTAKNLARIVWSEKSGINHIKCEAAFCLASPKIPLTTVRGNLAMDIGAEEVEEMLEALHDIALQHKAVIAKPADS